MPDHLDAARKAIEHQLASLRQEVKRQHNTSWAPAQWLHPRRPSQRANELVKANPGITIPELAQQMGIKQNYLYRVLPTLQNEKKVTKRGKGWHAATSS